MELVDNHIDEIWTFDLIDMSDCKTTSNIGFRYFSCMIDRFSKFAWCATLKKKNAQTIREKFSEFLSTSKRKPKLKKCKRRRIERKWYFSNFFETKNFLCFSDKRPSKAERAICTIKIFLKEPLFGTGKLIAHLNLHL